MAETVTLRKVFRDPVDGKFGPGIKTTIFVAEYPDVRMSSFAKGLDAWAEGDKVVVEITKKGEFTNFKPMGNTTVGQAGNAALESRVSKLEQAVFGATAAHKEPEVQTEVQDEFNDFK